MKKISAIKRMTISTVSTTIAQLYSLVLTSRFVELCDRSHINRYTWFSCFIAFRIYRSLNSKKERRQISAFDYFDFQVVSAQTNKPPVA